jgi:serine/threonine protein kinase
VEKQSADLLAWSCRDSGNDDDARPVTEHSRHDIPIPERILLDGGTPLVFDRAPNTLLDEGASAAVFRARIEGHRDVAVKVSRLTGSGILRNTLLEYLMLRRAQGIDGVIRLYGAGFYHVAAEVFFFIVEEIAETTLAGEFERRKAAREPYAEKEVRDGIIKPLLATLARLHERGIIHRDLKPKNIYRVDGACKIGDFEIAAYSREESRALHTGMFAGSPAYTTAGALEGRYGPDTDINALACISYMMLRGDLPAIEDAPGTSTLVRGIRAGDSLTEDEKLRQEKAKKALQEWLTQKRGYVTQIRRSLRSTPFERFFVAPILSQGLYPQPAPGSIRTAEDALKALSRIELSEQAQEVRRKALELARKGDFDAAKEVLADFDAPLNRKLTEETEVSIHVMIGETLKEISDLEMNPEPALVLPFDNAELFADGRAVESDWRYYESGKAVGRKTDAIGKVSRDGRNFLTISLRVGDAEAELLGKRHDRSPADFLGKFSVPEPRPGPQPGTSG